MEAIKDLKERDRKIDLENKKNTVKQKANLVPALITLMVFFTLACRRWHIIDVVVISFLSFFLVSVISSIFFSKEVKGWKEINGYEVGEEE